MMLAFLFTFFLSTQAVTPLWYPINLPLLNDIQGEGWSGSERFGDWYKFETPITVHLTQRFTAVSWDALATMSDTYKSPWTRDDPILRAPEGYRTSFHKVVAIYYALSHWFEKAQTAAVPENIRNFEKYGLAEFKLNPEDFADVYNCVKKSPLQIKGCLSKLVPESSGNDDQNLDMEMCAFFGAVAAANAIRVSETDGWNVYGELSRTGEKCQTRCAPYGDYTGYAPVNSPWELKEPKRWQPLTEDNGRGFVYTQEHVTPQLTKVDYIANYGANPTLEDPEYDLDKEMELVYERTAKLAGNSTAQAMVKAFDNKLDVFVSMFVGMMGQIGWQLSLEERMLWFLGFTTAEFDAVVAAWRAKVKHDLVRPTSWSREMVDKKKVKWFNGQEVDTDQWTPLIRVMPHAEYPSGSSAICKAVVDFSQLFFDDAFGFHDMATSWSAPKGSLEGGLPTEDVSFTMNSLRELVDMCGQSRLDGGMHFTAAVKAGEDVVEAFGFGTFLYTSDMRNGEELPKWEKNCGRFVKMTGKNGKPVKPFVDQVTFTQGSADSMACDCEMHCEEKGHTSYELKLLNGGRKGKCKCFAGEVYGTEVDAKGKIISGPWSALKEML